MISWKTSHSRQPELADHALELPVGVVGVNVHERLLLLLLDGLLYAALFPVALDAVNLLDHTRHLRLPPPG